MNQYMAVINLPEEVTQEFISLIPQQRALVDELLFKNVIMSYSLAIDRSVLWVTFQAENEEEVYGIIDTFPLRQYMVASVVELAFHNSIKQVFPDISLN